MSRLNMDDLPYWAAFMEILAEEEVEKLKALYGKS